jgi:uncharacterized protein YjiS (DUF1127 family)
MIRSMMTTFPFALVATSALRTPFAAAENRLAEWRRRTRSRRELMKVSDRYLNDIGVSRCDAEVEASKPFWVA